MHQYVLLLLLLCGWRASGHFLPLKGTPLLQNKNKFAIIDEMLCLLENENTSFNEKLTTPIFVMNINCISNYTNEFIHQLNRLNSTCMKVVTRDMEKLRDNCAIMKTKSAHENACSDMKVDFSKFRRNLEEFLRWLIRTNNCSYFVRDDSDLYGGSKCTCSQLQKL